MTVVEQILKLSGDVVLFGICGSFAACLTYVIVGSLIYQRRKNKTISRTMFVDGAGELIDYREEVAEYKNSFS